MIARISQLGGVFIISKTEGILYQHQEQFAGDHANLEELLLTVKQIDLSQPNADSEE